MTQDVASLEERLFTSPDVDAAREFFRQKSRALVPKVTTAREATARLIRDGDYVAVGGFGTNRIPTAILHEILRQGRRHLGLSGHTATHDFQILAAGECFDRCDAAYVVGLEARGLSPSARRIIQDGKVKVVEWTNASLNWRYKAAAMGVPFLPVRMMLGTDTLERSGARVIECPFTGIKLAAVPALFPDVGIIHVHRCDQYGNAQIDGILVADAEVARASRKVILTTERIVPNEEIRSAPHRTVIPYYCVDAVVEVRYGSYPGNMAYEYFSDEEHLRQWLTAEEDPEELRRFLDKYIHGVKDFGEYLELCGGKARLAELEALERLNGREEH